MIKRLLATLFTPRMHGRKLEVVVLGLAGCDPELKPEVWTTTHPHPYESLEMPRMMIAAHHRFR